MKSRYLVSALAFLQFFLSGYSSASSSLSINTEAFLSQPLAGNQRYPVSSFANGVHLVVWEEGNETWGGDSQIRALIISDNRTAGASFTVSNANDVQEKPAVTNDGSNFFVVWQDFRSGSNYDIYGARVNSSGQVLDPNGIAIATGPGNQCMPSVSYDGTNFIAVWMDNRVVPYSYHIRAARISRNGTLIDINSWYLAGPSDAASLSQKISSGNLMDVPMFSLPVVACFNQKCLLSFMAKDSGTLAFSQEPRFAYLNTNAGIALDGSIITLPGSIAYSEGDSLRGPQSSNGTLSCAVNSQDKYLLINGGATGHNNASYFMAALSFNPSSRNAPVTLNVRKASVGGYLGKSAVVPNGDKFLVIWADSNGDMSNPMKFSIKGALIDSNNNVSTFTVFDSDITYRGFPHVSVGSNYGLLVYEKDAGSAGIQVAGMMFDKDSLPLNVAPTPPPPAFDFSLTNAGDKSVIQGGSVSNSIGVSLLAGTSQPVSFSVKGLPAQVTAAFSSNVCSPACTTIITISASTSAQPGIYPLTITGSNGAVSRSTSFSITLTASTPPPTPNKPSAPRNLRFGVNPPGTPGSPVTSFQVTSPLNDILPFTVGLGFKKGDVPTTPSLDIPDHQVIVKRRWNDGSVKHALASGHVALSANTPKTITVLNNAAPQSRANLTASDIQAANPQASVQLGGFGTVTLSNLLANPFRTWISGPEMVEAHYRSAAGSDPALSVWFYVRLYKSGRIWIRTIVENGYIDVATVNKSYVPLVTIGAAIIYDNKGGALTHYAHTRWAVEGWIGGDPQVVPKHDTSYLISTRLVPNYWKRNPTSSAFASLAQTYNPMDRGNLTQSMGMAGFQSQIGLLPLWDALYVTSGNSRAYRATLANASSMNSYPIVWRDSKTQLVAKPSSYPTFGLGTYDYAAGPNVWEMNHAPSEGYLAYLITGDYWYYETLLMQASFNYLALSSSRGTGVNRLLTAETRGTAWNLRTLTQVTAIAPEGDEVAAEYQMLLANNMNHWKSVKDRLGGTGIGYLYERNINNYGTGTIAPWQQHFFIQSVGMGSDIEPLSNMNTYNEVRDWLYRGIVGILGDSSGYCFNYASRYNIVIADGSSNDPATWFSNWSMVYSATLGSPACSNVLGGAGSGAPEAAPYGYWGNLLPAIAYAVDHSASGASSAWQRLINASNWSVLENSGFDNIPIWGIVPRNLSAK